MTPYYATHIPLNTLIMNDLHLHSWHMIGPYFMDVLCTYYVFSHSHIINRYVR